MADMKNPDALAGASGSEKPVQAVAEGTQRLARQGADGTPYRIAPHGGAFPGCHVLRAHAAPVREGGAS